MIFRNEQIDLTDLPQVETVEFRKLSPAYKKAEYIGTVILFFFLLIATVVLYFNFVKTQGHYATGIFAVWGFLFAISLLLVSKRYEMAGYALREHDVVHKYGVWWQTITTIPFNRMQHCEISQGPVQHAFRLATLRIFTAGGSSSDLAIDGLDQEEAKRIKEFITEKISGQVAPRHTAASTHSDEPV
ncbi:MAG TPA: hypothetical protein ENJ20_04795 [Bacteroidetes bacterium]|nr:hypothetical protein [Bacteroidota bacterium]